MKNKNTYTNILQALRRGGFKVKSKETTPGARKAWLEPKEKMHWVETMYAAKQALEGFYFSANLEEISGRGFFVEYSEEIEWQGIFLAVYKNRPRGEEFAFGIDC